MKRIFKGLGCLAVIVLIAGASVFIYLAATGKNVYDLALPALNLVKKAKGNQVGLSKLDTQARPILDHIAWNNQLAKYVSDTGTVDYKAWQNDIDSLDGYLTQLSENPPGSNWSDADTMAYWINAYNAFTIKLILNNYPLESVKDISKGLPLIASPWDMKFFKIDGIDFDLNTIEHEILRKDFDEPRIHFAVNCASFSCPKLLNVAYTGTDLEQQLDTQARAFINNPDKNKFTIKGNRVSAIFSWFKSDFTKKQSLAEFLANYSDDFNSDLPIKFLEYDWGLNE